MRAMFLVLGSLLLCAGLFGCDNRPQATVSAPVAVTAPPACNCNQQPPSPAPVVRTAQAGRHHIRRHGAEYGESDGSTSPQSDTQDYSSSEETMTQDRHHGHHRHTVAEFERMYPNYGENDQNTSSQDYSESSETMTQDDDAGPMRRPAWVDGYGRAHFRSDDASQDENPARLNREERHIRRDPYRGWNSDCDERDAVN